MPEVGVAVIVSLQAALQLLLVEERLMVIPVPAELKVYEAVAVHPFASVTVTVYVAMQTFDNEFGPGHGTAGPLEDQQ